MTEPTAELFDLGYQHYEGPREGRMRARKAVFVNGFRTALGLGRGSLAKVLPILLFAAAMAPAIIIALIVSTADELDINLPGHSDYYQIVSIILIIFSAIIAPELLCTDRRTGVISLYLVRPLTVTDYVAGRWLAFFSITLLIFLEELGLAPRGQAARPAREGRSSSPRGPCACAAACGGGGWLPPAPASCARRVSRSCGAASSHEKRPRAAASS